MADLSDLNAAQTVKIAGASSSGSETNFVNATANNELRSADILATTVAQGTLSISTAGSTELRVGASRLANCKMVKFQAQGTNLTYGYSSGSQPFTVSNGETITETLGPGISIWLRRSSGIGSITVAIAEFA